MKLALVAAAWLSGMLLGLERDLPLVPLYLLLGASAASGLALYLLGWSVFPAVLAAFLVLGLWRAEASQGNSDPLTTRFEQQVSVLGTIADDPEATSKSIGFELSVSAIDRGTGYEPAPGRVLVYAAPPGDLAAQRPPPYFRYGDRLEISGTLRRPVPFDGFDFPAFLAAQGISGVLLANDVSLAGEGGDWWRKAAYSLRSRLSGSTESALSYPESALGQALLLGQRGRLPDDVAEDFRNTGAAHLLAISGMHVGILLVMTLGMAAWLLGRRRQVYLLVPLAVICVYALVSGGSPSVVRAAIMGAVYLAAWGSGRPHSALPAIGLSAAAMTAISPELLRQASFQLSFAAVAGIALALSYFPLHQFGWGQPDRSGWRWRMARPITGMVVVSTAAALATWPLVAYHFGQAALLSVPVTVVALPAMPFVMVTTLAAAVTGLAHPALGEFFGWVAWVPAQYLIWVVSVVPAWTFEIGWAGKWLLACWYGGLVALLLVGSSIRGYSIRGGSHWRWISAARGPVSKLRLSPREAPFVAVAVAGVAAAVVLWLQVFSGPGGQLHVYFFDVGQGDSALIVTPSGRQVLVDGGPSVESATLALSRAASPSGRRLDLVVLTHLDADHTRGLVEVLESYRTGAVLVGRDDPDASMRAVWTAALQRENIEPLPVHRGYLIDLGSGVELEVLNPPDSPRLASANDGGLVLRLTYGSVSFLLAADIEAAAEGELARMGPRIHSTVLKVAHHGSKTSSTGPFLDAVSPSIAMISVGGGNSYGHPNPQVMERLESHVGEDGLYRTDQDGSVEFITDGESLWAQTER